MSTDEQVIETPAFLFNPPTASEYEDGTADELPCAFSLKRDVGSVPRVRRSYNRLTKDGTAHYYKVCGRVRCDNTIECYRVVTGTVNGIEQVVYYYADRAIVMEDYHEMMMRTRRTAFCSYRCLHLTATTISKDQRE